MTVPAFTAEASLYLSRRSYLTHKTAAPSGEIISAGPFGPPHINLSYQPPPQPGALGLLSVSGFNFAPNAQVTLTIGGCYYPPYPSQVNVLTDGFHEDCYELLGHRFCKTSLGGNFYAQNVAGCFCAGGGGGSAFVTAQDLFGNTASATAYLPCR